MVINNNPDSDTTDTAGAGRGTAGGDDGTLGAILGVIIVAALLVLMFFYLLPSLRNNVENTTPAGQGAGTQSEIPVGD